MIYCCEIASPALPVSSPIRSDFISMLRDGLSPFHTTVWKGDSDGYDKTRKRTSRQLICTTREAKVVTNLDRHSRGVLILEWANRDDMRRKCASHNAKQLVWKVPHSMFWQVRQARPETDVFPWCLPVLTRRSDDLLKNWHYNNDIDLNYSEPDSIICQNHIYDHSLVLAWLWGALCLIIPEL